MARVPHACAYEILYVARLAPLAGRLHHSSRYTPLPRVGELTVQSIPYGTPLFVLVAASIASRPSTHHPRRHDAWDDDDAQQIVIVIRDVRCTTHSRGLPLYLHGHRSVLELVGSGSVASVRVASSVPARNCKSTSSGSCMRGVRPPRYHTPPQR